MPRKIYDILPPKIASKVEDTIRSLDIKSKSKTRRRKEARTQKKAPQKPAKERFPMKEILVGGAVIALLLGIYFYGRLPRVHVEILPRLDLTTVEEKVTADKSVKDIDLQKKIIPLEVLEEVKESSQEFPATGIASNDGKATGIITIYNKVSPATPLTLVKGTHFLSDSGKYFITLSKITIPAMKGKTPGLIAVKVQAEEVGANYNIKSSKFSVPKLSGTIYYYGIFGESDKAMAGGYAGKVKKVTIDDIEIAKEILTKKLLQDAEQSLKSKISEGKILLKGAVLSSVVSANSSVEPEAIADGFNQSAKVKVLGLVFKEENLKKIAKDKILSQLPEGKILLDGSLNLEYGADAIDFLRGTEKISLQISAKSYYNMDFEGLADLFKRKSSAQIRDIIDLQYGQDVSEVKINFWPFWVKKAPKDINRIAINLKFE